MNFFEKIELDTLRTRLFIAFLFVGFVPFLSFTFFSYNIYSRALHNNIISYTKEVVLGIGNHLDTYLDDLNLLLEMTDDYYINQSIKLIQAQEYSRSRKYIFRLWEEFHNIRRLKSGVTEFSLTFQDGQRLSNYGLYYLHQREMDYFSHLHEPGLTMISKPHLDFYDSNVITLSRIFDTQEERVYISIAVALSALREMINDKLGPETTLFIMDSEGEIILHSDDTKIGTTSSFYSSHLFANSHGNFIHNKEKDSAILTYATSHVTGWIIVSVAKARQVTGELDTLKEITVYFVIIILGCLVLFINFISHYLTNPIRKLEAVTKVAANNNLDVKIETKGRDEIAKLSRSFDKMLKRIKELVEKNNEEQRQIRNLEMKTLHEQIKPHFIYNTLDLIIGYLEKEDAGGKGPYLIEALGKFFRLSFAEGKELVTIREELEHVKSYLYLQQERFEDRFEYFIEIKDKEIYSFYIPKLLLQPLVENAIHHGVLEIQKRGIIIIHAFIQEEDIVFEVIDNGKGIPSHQVKEINHIFSMDYKELKEGKYFGLRNVNMRIRHKFGDTYHLRLESQLGAKTVITMRIGMIGEEDSDDESLTCRG